MFANINFCQFCRLNEAGLTEMLPGGSGRQVLLEVPGDGFSQSDRFDEAGLTEIVLLP